MLDPKQITDDLRGAFRGRLHFDALTRGLYATDASPFQVTPARGRRPRGRGRRRRCSCATASSTTCPLIPRGAGTGLAGEASARRSSST